MNAIKFIKDHGVEKAREAISNCCWMEKSYCTKLGHGCIKNNHDCCVDVDDLKRLVESVDLINSQYDGIESAKELLNISPKLTDELRILGQAIADYESIYSNDMGDDSHIENHISKNCKVIEHEAK